MSCVSLIIALIFPSYRPHLVFASLDCQSASFALHRLQLVDAHRQAPLDDISTVLALALPKWNLVVNFPFQKHPATGVVRSPLST